MDYYLTQANRVHRGEDDPLITLDSIILNQEKSLSWGVPVAMGLATLVAILGGLGLRMRRRAQPVGGAASDIQLSAKTSDDGGPAKAVVQADEELLQDELDELGL